MSNGGSGDWCFPTEQSSCRGTGSHFAHEPISSTQQGGCPGEPQLHGSLRAGRRRGGKTGNPPPGEAQECHYFALALAKGAAKGQAGIAGVGWSPGDRASCPHRGTSWQHGHRCFPALGRASRRSPNATSWGVIGAATSADGDARYKAPAGPVVETRASPPWPTYCPPACSWSCCSWPRPCPPRTSEGSSSTW